MTLTELKEWYSSIKFTEETTQQLISRRDIAYRKREQLLRSENDIYKIKLCMWGDFVSYECEEAKRCLVSRLNDEANLISEYIARLDEEIAQRLDKWIAMDWRNACANDETTDQQTSVTDRDLCTLDEAVFYTGFSRNTLYRFTSKKEIPHYKVNGSLRFKRSELAEWMTQRRITKEQ